MNSFSDTKSYLRPLGFIPKEIGVKLQKNNDAMCINDNFYTCIELIKKKKNEILKKQFTISDFHFFIKKKNKIQDLLNSLLKKKKTFLNNKNLIKTNKNHIIFSILNLTPDSFSDGGENLNTKKNFNKGIQMIKDGADFIDIGGESTRPGANKVDSADELIRILPTIQLLDSANIKMSLDTRNSSTMELGILSGIKIINDVSALSNDKKSIEIIKKYNVPIILMHMPGNPKNMMKNNKYFDVTLDVYNYLEERIIFCEKNGISRSNIIIDPGIGFGKDFKQNISLMKNLSIFHTLMCPIMLGISRKRFISAISKDCEPKDRLGGTISSTLLALSQGIQIHRVHDVKESRQAIDIFENVNQK